MATERREVRNLDGVRQLAARDLVQRITSAHLLYNPQIQNEASRLAAHYYLDPADSERTARLALKQMGFGVHPDFLSGEFLNKLKEDLDPDEFYRAIQESYYPCLNPNAVWSLHAASKHYPDVTGHSIQSVAPVGAPEFYRAIQGFVPAVHREAVEFMLTQPHGAMTQLGTNTITTRASASGAGWQAPQPVILAFPQFMQWQRPGFAAPGMRNGGHQLPDTLASTDSVPGRSDFQSWSSVLQPSMPNPEQAIAFGSNEQLASLTDPIVADPWRSQAPELLMVRTGPASPVLLPSPVFPIPQGFIPLPQWYTPDAPVPQAPLSAVAMPTPEPAALPENDLSSPSITNS